MAKKIYDVGTKAGLSQEALAKDRTENKWSRGDAPGYLEAAPSERKNRWCIGRIEPQRGVLARAQGNALG
jgi:hypothetical protein